MGAPPQSDEFLRLLRPLQPALERFARHGLRDPSLTEDVLQDAVLAAFEDFSSFTPGTNFRAWMFKVVSHRVLRANGRSEPVNLHEIPADLAVDDTWQSAEAEAGFQQLVDDPDRFAAEFEQPLAGALRQLAAPERACLLLKSVGEFSYREIHEMLDIPVGSVMGYLSRARRRLRNFLSEYAATHGRPCVDTPRETTEEPTPDAPPVKQREVGR